MEFEGKTIVIAESDIIGEYDEIAREFLDAVFDQDLDECLITDESCLSDFSGCCLPEDYEPPAGLTKQERFNHLYEIGDAEMIKIVKERYGIDVSPDDYLITVFEKIRKVNDAFLN